MIVTYNKMKILHALTPHQQKRHFCGDWFDNRHHANRNNNNEKIYLIIFEKSVDLLFLTANQFTYSVKWPNI